jgi:hypothetical protein
MLILEGASSMKKFLKFTAVVMSIMFIFALTATVHATVGPSRFVDVKDNHWAIDEILWMVENKIIEGVGGNRFEPGRVVTRAEFAKMMVLTLRIQLFSPATPFFLDVKKNDWEYQYVESARFYLTGFRTSSGDYYKPDEAAVREDMAVALVKALGYSNETADMSVLDKFADKGQISEKLRSHVALAVKHGLMQGYNENGKTYFKPKNNLTRAEAAVLLYRAFKNNEEKITYDDNKVTYDDDYTAPTVSVSSESNRLVVNWNKIASNKLKAYAVVVSKNNKTPGYPDNGYLHYITDKNQTSAVIDNSTEYKGTSDFGKYLKKSEEYYISVTAVYNDRNVKGNAVRKKYNGPQDPSQYTAPNVTVSIENGTHVVRWNRSESTEFSGYAVVISKNDDTPKYPDNGYLTYITDRNRCYAVINNSSKYNNGDFGNYLTKGEKYYVSVTTVYNDRNIAGNTVRFKYDGPDDPEAYVAPKITSAVENGRLVLRWSKIDSPKLQGYKVVASKDDSTPSYPENGYLYWITDKNRDYAVIDNTAQYNGGDFGKYFISGQTYHFSVTAIYSDRNVAGNTLTLKYEGPDSPELFPAPVVKAEYENGKLVIKWNKIESPELVEYRVVISQNSQSPVYPANGYYEIYNKDTTSAILDETVEYTNGDFKKLIDGTEYYFSVTAVYNNSKYIAGNAVKKLYLLPPRQ